MPMVPLITAFHARHSHLHTPSSGSVALDRHGGPTQDQRDYTCRVELRRHVGGALSLAPAEEPPVASQESQDEALEIECALLFPAVDRSTKCIN